MFFKKRSPVVPHHEIPYATIPTTEEVGSKGVNKQGYRCVDFSERGQLNVLTIGCEWSENYGGDSISKYICQGLSSRFGVKVSDWNMALDGRSADYVVRTLLCSLPVLKPDLVVVCFPSADRREYFRADSKRIKYTSELRNEESSNSPAWNKIGTVDREIIHNLNGAQNPIDDASGYLKSIKTVELLLETNGIPWIYSVVGTDQNVDTLNDLFEGEWISKSAYAGKVFERIDSNPVDARRPGPESVKAFGTYLFEQVVSRFSDALTASARR